MTSRYVQEKESMKRYAKSRKGKLAHRKAKRAYRFSFHGQMKRRLWNKHLTSVEEEKATTAFKNFKGKCDCCGSTEPHGKNWHLDHKDGKFRGILCHLCNCAAAFLRDSIKICNKLSKYLERTCR